MANRFSILVGIVATHDGEILLLRRSLREKFMPGAWGIPAGKIDFGEDLESAVMRELMEESGLVAREITLVGASKFMSQKGEDDLHNLQVNYVVSVDKSDVVLDHSNDEYRWIRFEDLEDFGVDKFTSDTIAQARSIVP